MNDALCNILGKYPLAEMVMRTKVLPEILSLRDYSFLQHVMWACKDRKNNVLNVTGPIVLGTHLYETKAEMQSLFRMCRKYLYEVLVPVAIFPTLENVLLVSVAAMQTERSLIWDSSKASNWLENRGDKVSHWLTDDVFVLSCIGQLVKYKAVGGLELLDWFMDGSPCHCAYELQKLLENQAEMSTALTPVAEQFGQGRWKAAIDAYNKSIHHPCQDMRCFQAAGLDLVEFLPLLGQDGKIPRFGEVNDPIHQGGIAYFKT